MYKKINKKKFREYLQDKGVWGDVEPLFDKMIALDNLADYYAESVINEGVMMKSQRGQKQNPAVSELTKVSKQVCDIMVELLNYEK